MCLCVKKGNSTFIYSVFLSIYYFVVNFFHHQLRKLTNTAQKKPLFLIRQNKTSTHLKQIKKV